MLTPYTPDRSHVTMIDQALQDEMDSRVSVSKVLPRVARTGGSDTMPAVRSPVCEVGELQDSRQSLSETLARLRELHQAIGDRRVRLDDPAIRALINDENFMSVWRTMLDLYGAVDKFLCALDLRKG